MNQLVQIVGFHQDEVGDWVATLSCGHTRHIRHEPPLSDYPWVMTTAGRQRFLGETIPCRECGTQEKQSTEGS